MGRGLILIRQLASRGRLSPKSSFRAYPVLAAVSNCYPGHEGRLSTRYSPVRHSTRDRSLFRVRLACVKHAASVQSEPESNSPVQICIKIPAWQKSESQRLFLPTRYSLVNEPPEGLRPLPLFSAARCRFMHHPPGCVNNFFRSGEVFFAVPRKAQKRVVQSREVEDIHPPLICQRFFVKKLPGCPEYHRKATHGNALRKTILSPGSLPMAYRAAPYILSLDQVTLSSSSESPEFALSPSPLLHAECAPKYFVIWRNMLDIQIHPSYISL